jgi:hypothetical protein
VLVDHAAGMLLAGPIDASKTLLHSYSFQPTTLTAADGDYLGGCSLMAL